VRGAFSFYQHDFKEAFVCKSDLTRKLFCFSCSFAFLRKLLHRYSIAGPSFRWRNDGELMENWWSSDGDAAKDKPTIPRGKTIDGYGSML